MNPKQSSPTHLLLLGFVLAFCSIVYELILAKTLAMLTGATVIWMSITIGVYIAALGIGTYWYERRKKMGQWTQLSVEEQRGQRTRMLLRLELYLSLIGSLCVVTALLIHLLYRIYIYNGGSTDAPLFFQFNRLAFLAITCQMITFVVGILSGFEIPILIDLANLETNEDQSHRILGANYLGSLVGTLLFALVLLPQLDVLYTSALIGSCNLLVCLYLWRRPESSGNLSDVVFLGTNLLVIVIIVAFAKPMYQLHLKNFYYNSSNQVGLTRLRDYLATKPRVVRTKSLYQNIDQVIDVDDPNDPNYAKMTLYLNGHFQFHEENESYYHENMVHVPIQVFRNVPPRVLMLGGGDGLAIRELLKYGNRIQSITQIELDKKMIHLGKFHPILRKLNRNSLHHPKVTIIIDDAFSFLRNTSKKYDAIFIDFPYPYNYELSKLYSREFYQFAARRLAKHGFVAIDGFVGNKASRFTNVLLSTLYYAGFKNLFPYHDEKGYESFITAKRTKSRLHFEMTYQGICHPPLARLEQRFPHLATLHQPQGMCIIREEHRVAIPSFVTPSVRRRCYQHITPSALRKLAKFRAPHQIHRKYINSIFHPRLLNLTDPFF